MVWGGGFLAPRPRDEGGGLWLSPSCHTEPAELNTCLPVAEKALLCIPLNRDFHPLPEKSSSGPPQKARGRAESGLK